MSFACHPIVLVPFPFVVLMLVAAIAWKCRNVPGFRVLLDHPEGKTMDQVGCLAHIAYFVAIFVMVKFFFAHIATPRHLTTHKTSPPHTQTQKFSDPN
jgi:hypothetical protein